MENLTSKEVEIINKIHDFMAYTDKEIDCGNGKKAKHFDYKKLPEGVTFLLFGGYKSVGFHTADALKAYYAEYKKWPNLVIIGKSSNKIDNTAGLGSEVKAYQYILTQCGIPKKVIEKFYMEPTDTSTAENTQSLRKILAANKELQGKVVALFTQPYYARRALHDFIKQIPRQTFIVANTPKPDLEKGIFYNDRADGTAIDAMVGACFYHAMYNKTRWETGETTPPTAEELQDIPSLETIKPILKKFSGWIYPNNIVDLGLAADLSSASELIRHRKEIINNMPSVKPEGHLADINNEIAKYKQKILLNTKKNHG